MMTKDEFQHKYHDYQTVVLEDAITEAVKSNRAIGLSSLGGDLVVPVGLPFGDKTIYCLMFKHAVVEGMVIGIIPFQPLLLDLSRQISQAVQDGVING